MRPATAPHVENNQQQKEHKHMTAEEPISFIDYWDALDAAMLKFFGIDTADAGIEADRIAQAQEGGDSPQDFALWFGEKYDLTLLSQSTTEWGGQP
jgi:hypothetical protein